MRAWEKGRGGKRENPPSFTPRVRDSPNVAFIFPLYERVQPPPRPADEVAITSLGKVGQFRAQNCKHAHVQMKFLLSPPPAPLLRFLCPSPPQSPHPLSLATRCKEKQRCLSTYTRRTPLLLVLKLSPAVPGEGGGGD